MRAWTGAVLVAALVATGCTKTRTRTVVQPVSPGPAPTITSVAPALGPTAGGTTLTITGSDFASGVTVEVGGNAATGVTRLSSTQLTAVTPAGSGGFVAVVVTNPDAQTGTLASGFEYRTPPTLSSIVPPSGTTAGGTAFTVYGSGFASGATVSIGGVAATGLVVNGPGTEIRGTSPAGLAGARDVLVRNPDTLTATLVGGFTYVLVLGQDPTIASVSPATGPTAGGNTVTITGSNFLTSGTTRVWFGATAGTSVAVASTTSVTAVAPGGVSGTRVDVAVTNPNGTSASATGAYGYDTAGSPPTFGGLTTATALSAHAIELRWSAASDNASPASAIRYAVYVATSSGGQNFGQPSAITPPGATVYTLAGGLAPSTTYYVVVRARDEIGNEETNTVEQSATTLAGVAVAWRATGSLVTAREVHTATLLLDGRVLAVGGSNAGGLASAELYDQRAGTWSATGALATARLGHTATLLASGRVLVAGGNGTATATVEVYDPATGSWSATSSLGTARWTHTATLLPDGRVLIAGGESGGVAFASAELYDPTTGTWSGTGALAAARNLHTAVALSGGPVMVVGGANGGVALASCEIWSPASGAWSGTGPLGTAREQHGTVVLASGAVLGFAGFSNGTFLASAELFNPATGAWTGTGGLTSARHFCRGLRLPDGTVLTAGGQDSGGFLAMSEVYDPATGAWSAVGSLSAMRRQHTLTLLANGTALVVGGWNGSVVGGCETYDPAVGRWRTTGALTARYILPTAPLPDGRVMVAGGRTTSAVATAEVYDPVLGTWSAVSAMSVARSWHTLTLLAAGRVLAAGGQSAAGPSLASVECYDPTAGTWSATGALATARVAHTATILHTGRVLVAGGGVGTTELYDPMAGTWSGTGALPATASDHTATLLPSGKVLLVGTSAAGSTTYLYDPATGTWTATGSLGTGRFRHAATLLPRGWVLVSGGTTAGTYLSSVEVYDPATGTWTVTGSLGGNRGFHTAMQLPGGAVLVAGGYSGLAALGTAEIYDPASGTWTAAPTIGTARFDHTTARLADGRVLLAGGQNGSGSVGTAELYDEGRDFAAGWRPDIQTVAGSSAFPTSLPYASAVTVTGVRFRGLSEAGSGGTLHSPSDAPVVTLTGPLGGTSGEREGGAGREITVPVTAFATGTALAFTTPASGTIAPGYYHLRVVANGIPSEARIVRLP